jgi:hypothetical protein
MKGCSLRAIFLVDTNGRVLHMNSHAETLVTSQRSGLRLQRGVLKAATPEEENTFRRLITEAAKTSARDGTSAGGSLCLAGPLGRALHVLASPITLRHFEREYSRPLAIVIAREARGRPCSC